MDEMNNYVRLRGVAAGAPTRSHENRGVEYSVFPLEVQRLSGAADTVNILVRTQQIQRLELEDNAKLCVTGSLRSYNNRSGEGSKLVITVYARELVFEDGDDENTVLLRGTLCRESNLRVTPMGREICDLMLAVNRQYGHSDYLPCIAWGMRAREAADWQVGTRVSLNGRIQSRRYIKNEDGLLWEKTAYEVSVIEFIEQTASDRASY